MVIDRHRGYAGGRKRTSGLFRVGLCGKVLGRETWE